MPVALDAVSAHMPILKDLSDGVRMNVVYAQCSAKTAAFNIILQPKRLESSGVVISSAKVPNLGHYLIPVPLFKEIHIRISSIFACNKPASGARLLLAHDPNSVDLAQSIFGWCSFDLVGIFQHEEN
jgi:hypothetical protein